MQREIIGTVVGTRLLGANEYSIEVECDALEDVTAFEIVSISLPFERIALEAAAGSRVNLACAEGPNVSAGMQVTITISSKERVEDRGGPLSTGRVSDDQLSGKTPIGTFGGPT